MPLDWEKFKPDIQKLYKDEDKPLGDVMALLEQRYGFKASSAMLLFPEICCADLCLAEDIIGINLRNGASSKIAKLAARQSHCLNKESLSHLARIRPGINRLRRGSSHQKLDHSTYLR